MSENLAIEPSLLTLDFQIPSAIFDKKSKDEAIDNISMFNNLFGGNPIGYPNYEGTIDFIEPTTTVLNLANAVDQTSRYNMYISITDTYNDESINETYIFSKRDSYFTMSVPPSLKEEIRRDGTMIAESKEKLSGLSSVLKNIYFIGKASSLFFALLNVAVIILGIETFTLTGNLVGILISMIFYYVFVNEELTLRQD